MGARGGSTMYVRRQRLGVNVAQSIFVCTSEE